MKPRSLWTIILKICGLYFLLQLFYLFGQLFSIVLYAQDATSAEVLKVIGLDMLLMIGCVLVIYVLIFKTGLIIDTLKLDKGFTEEKLSLNIHRSTVLRIAVIVTGALIFIDGLPELVKDIFYYYHRQHIFSGGLKQYAGSGWIIFYLVKVFVGYFMMSGNTLIVNFIERQRKVSFKTEE